jgi:UDP-N-acetylmuramoylalanine--D-glutamate ligase
MGAPAEAIAQAAHAFTGVEHVLELAGEVGGVRFFNDSKATNIDAARKSLLAFDGPVLAILGGRYKGGDFADLADVAAGRCKKILAIGEAQERIARGLSSVVPVLRCETLDAAVDEAFRSAAPGDTILLAPACSSFDMFRDYADRGRAFKAAVRRLAALERG